MKQILILDDEPNVISALSRLLRRNHYKVYSAIDVDQAFHLLQQNDIGVVISDQKMPRCTGIEFLNQVRQRYPSIVRIILSGYSENDSLLDAINEGEIYRYIKKPWDNKTLLSIIADSFNKWSAEWQSFLLDMAFNNSIEGIVFSDEKGLIYWANAEASKLLGYENKELNGTNLSQLIFHEKIDELMPDINFTLNENSKWRGKSWFNHLSGKKIPVTMTATQVITDRGDSHYVYNFYDITEEYQYQKNIEHKAFHDGLTSLPNRGLFQDRVDRALVQAKRNAWTVAILFLDLDDFKPVNDKFGHQVGDMALQEIANRLLKLVREEDTVSRIGGDEFAILLPRFGSDIFKLKQLAEKVVKCVSLPIEFNSKKFSLGVSIGVVIYPDSGCDVQQLLNHADVAMYEAKNAGKNRYKIYHK